MPFFLPKPKGSKSLFTLNTKQLTFLQVYTFSYKRQVTNSVQITTILSKYFVCFVLFDLKVCNDLTGSSIFYGVLVTRQQNRYLRGYKLNIKLQIGYNILQ